MDSPAVNTIKGQKLLDGMTGVYAKGYILIAANVADEETVTVDGVVYEFDRADDGVATTGAVAVTTQSDDTPAEATDALIAMINANTSDTVRAIDIDDNTILILSNNPRNQTTAMAEDMAGSGNTVTAALYGGVAPTLDGVRGFSIVPTADDVITGEIHIPMVATITGAVVQVRTTATGDAEAWDGGVNIDATNNMLVLDNGGSTDWAVTSTINVIVF